MIKAIRISMNIYRFKSGFMLSLQVLLVFLLLFSCSSEKQQGTQPAPSAPAESATASKLEILPLEATRETTFYISSTEVDLLKTKVEWLVNGVPIEGASTSQFRPSEIKKGDKVQAKVLMGNQEMLSNQIRIKNIPPTITKAEIVPMVPKANDILKIDVIGSDRDGANISFVYEWSKNGEFAGSGETLEGPFKRDDKISVKITPFDGDDYGESIIITTNIYNSPAKPSGGNERFENNIYSYQVKATDPDSDPLTHTLKRAPKGMVIEKSTGLITWKVEEKDAGRHPVSVQVSDGHGGEVLYNFDVTLGFEGLIK